MCTSLKLLGCFLALLTLTHCKATAQSQHNPSLVQVRPNADTAFLKNVVPALQRILVSKSYQELVPPEGIEVIAIPHNGNQSVSRATVLTEATTFSSEEGTPSFRVSDLATLVEEAQSAEKLDSLACSDNVCSVQGGEVMYTGTLTFETRSSHLYLKSLSVRCGGAHMESD